MNISLHVMFLINTLLKKILNHFLKVRININLFIKKKFKLNLIDLKTGPVLF